MCIVEQQHDKMSLLVSLYNLQLEIFHLITIRAPELNIQGVKARGNFSGGGCARIKVGCIDVSDVNAVPPEQPIIGIAGQRGLARTGLSGDQGKAAAFNNDRLDSLVNFLVLFAEVEKSGVR